MRISDWSSDVCSSDLFLREPAAALGARKPQSEFAAVQGLADPGRAYQLRAAFGPSEHKQAHVPGTAGREEMVRVAKRLQPGRAGQLVLDARLAEQPSKRGRVFAPGRSQEQSDRKSVGSGKSGSVRVDIGGRRSIK